MKIADIGDLRPWGVAPNPTLPLIPFEVCGWSYGHKVGSNSHIWRDRGRHSVPCGHTGCKADVKFDSHLAFIYYNETEIARHQILPRRMANGMRTEQAHLPFPLPKTLSADSLRDRAGETGPKTFEAIRRMFDGAKAEEQPAQTEGAILAAADIHSPEILGKHVIKRPDSAIRLIMKPSIPVPRA